MGMKYYQKNMLNGFILSLEYLTGMKITEKQYVSSSDDEYKGDLEFKHLKELGFKVDLRGFKQKRIRVGNKVGSLKI